MQGMDEENEMGLKRKSKPVEKPVDSDDDEPIRTLLKLKGKRNSKRSKLDAQGGTNKVKEVKKMAAEDQDFGGMDDTLASFRKKLRGPKRNGGIVKGLSSKEVEPMCKSLNESVNGWESDSNLITEAQGTCFGSTEGGTSGGLKVKTKMKSEKSIVNSETRIYGNTESKDVSHHTESGNAAFQHEKEAEALEDSLSVFFQKVQSGTISKSRCSSTFKQGKETQILDDGSKPNSCASLEALIGKSLSFSKSGKELAMPDDNCHAASVKPTSISQNADDHLPEALDDTLEKPAVSVEGISFIIHDSNQICRSTDHADDSFISENSALMTTSLRTCSVKTAKLENGKIECETIDDQPEFADEEVNITLCENTAKITDDVKFTSELDTDLFPSDSGQVHLHSLPKEHQSGDGPVEEVDLATFSSQRANDQVSECRSSPMSDPKCELAFAKHNNDAQKVGIHALEHSCVLPEGECLPSRNDSSEDEETNRSMLDQHERFAEYKVSLADTGVKANTLSVGQRAARNAKKQRHEDMAYEGDIDWDVLMHSQEIFGSQIVDKTRERLGPSSTAVDAENRKVAAVAAGLKARAVGPLEKIKFKEVLKRKGGLQEYLECRSVTCLLCLSYVNT